MNKKYLNKKRLFFAIVLNLFAPGAGLHYLGRTQQGVLVFSGVMVANILGLILYIIVPIQYLMTIVFLIVGLGFNIFLVIFTVKYSPDKPRDSFLFKWYVSVGIVLIVILIVNPLCTKVIQKTICQAYVIPSSNMEKIFSPGDRILVNNFVFHFSEPQRGDIVSVRYNISINKRIGSVGRIIGLPGETIEIIDSVVFINGEELNEPYARILSLEDSKITEELYSEAKNYNLTTIPIGSYFIMGDNRLNSNDSRFQGFVDREKIFGRAEKIYWSDDLSKIDKILE